MPRHPDTRILEVREVFKSFVGFQAYNRAYIAIFSLPTAIRGPLREACCLRATDTQPLLNSLVYIILLLLWYFLPCTYMLVLCGGGV